MSAEHDSQYCDICKGWGDHTTALHKTWILRRRPKAPISKPVIQHRDPNPSTR